MLQLAPTSAAMLAVVAGFVLSTQMRHWLSAIPRDTDQDSE